MLDIKKLKDEQLKLAKEVRVSKDELKLGDLEFIGGCDQAFLDNNKIISAVVVLNYKKMELVEWKYAIDKAHAPYLPGFLSYRESPVIVKAYNLLKNKPQLLMVDGNGVLHQRRIGMASHLGLILDSPTIGVAKKLLLGNIEHGKILVEGRTLGYELKTRDISNPVYVSAGHKITLTTSLKIVKKCLKEHKLPEPLHLAHKFANNVKKKLKEKYEADRTAYKE